jgi:glycosyltransferase involved in cell wall biosynthesis
MPELVSILIPAYNAERWLAASIQSALAQTWPRTEIILVDDGSRDGTLAVARHFEGASVKVVTQPNKGAAAARNRAFELAQGSYIQWLDADDLLAADKVSKQMELAAQYADPRVLFSSAWGSFMYRSKRAHFAATALWRDLAPLEWIARKWTYNDHMQTATWLVSRHLSDIAGFWNTNLLGDDDGEYFARVVLASKRIVFVENARVYYRVVGSERLSHIGQSGQKLEAQLMSIELQIERVREVDDGSAIRAAIGSYLQTWLHVFYPERPDLVERLNQLARSVDGELRPARMNPKYAWIDGVFGRRVAKAVQREYNRGKVMWLRFVDRILYAVFGD